VDILIVDDEPHIRLAIAAMLLKQGHRVFQARDAISAAFEIYDNPAIGLMICDLQLPGLEGEAFIAVIKAQYPHIRVVATSVFDRRLWDACQKGADYKLLKPFSRREFLNVFGEAMPGAKAYAASI
jgi:two-component system, chemotaxis family, sensor histidine kinase and response regulator PixL